MNESPEFMEYEDISSSSNAELKKVGKFAKVKKVLALISAKIDNLMKRIDKVIKIISFVVAIGIFLVFAALAAVLILIDSFFILIAIGVLILGTVFALISLFLIYGLGHLISQNNEILEKL